MPASKTGKTEQQLKTNEKKWGKTVLGAGWNMFPNIILERQKALGLDAMDINILLHLMRHWWTAGNLPHPSKTTIAEAMGCHPRTIQKRIAAMEAAGFIQRIQRRTSEGSKTNRYDLSGLIEIITPYAKEKIEEINHRQKEDRATVGRKGKPKLAVVKN